MYCEYESFLNEKLEGALVIVVVALIISIIAVILTFGFKAERSYKIIASMILVVAIICSLCYVVPYKKDLDENSFIEYSGELLVEEVYRGRGSPMRVVVTFPDGKSRRYNMYDKIMLSEGSYSARILYSKHTNYLFEFEILN